MDPYFGIFGTVFKNGFGNTRRLQSVPFYLFFFFFLLISLFRLVFSVSKRRWRRRLSSRHVPPASVVCSVGRSIETAAYDQSLGPHGVSLFFSVRRQIQTHCRRRFCRSLRRLLRIGESLRCLVNAAVVKKFMKVSPIHRRFLFHASLILYDLSA